jgi:hypothetical protein
MRKPTPLDVDYLAGDQQGPALSLSIGAFAQHISGKSNLETSRSG